MFKQLVLTGLCGVTGLVQANESSSSNPTHVLLIMCDDMGFSDLGCYGGEIKTPNLDRLATQGVRFGHFRNTGRCCPSRASLLTGMHQHNVDMGWMTAVDEHRKGFRGQISDKIPTLAETLKQAGYRNYMSGKWHLTLDRSWQNNAQVPNGSWPTQRGFDEYYGGLSGGGSFWKPDSLARNLTRIPKSTLPADYYYTDAITAHAVEFINAHDTQQPMFMYLAHYAPHRPLQAPEARIQACIERYQVGYEVLMAQRFERQKALGLFPKDATLPIHNQAYGGTFPAWNTLGANRQKQWVREMATYAAMIEIMDEGIGEVLDALDKKGMMENTLVLFLSDNGATREGGLISQLAAQLSNTPFRSYKQWVYEGGVRSPLIIQWPKGLADNLHNRLLFGPAHITDLVPTCLDLIGITPLKTFNGHTVPAFDGRSLAPQLRGHSMSNETHFFEHQSSCAVIDKEWKLVRYAKSKPWELFHLANDPFETKPLGESYPEQFQKMKAQWEAWANKNQVLPLVEMGWNQRIKHFTHLHGDQDGVD